MNAVLDSNAVTNMYFLELEPQARKCMLWSTIVLLRDKVSTFLSKCANLCLQGDWLMVLFPKL